MRILFASGKGGAGKTTELNRLVAELRQDGIAAYYCDASTYLNLNDPQLSLAELLMTALAGLADAGLRAVGKHFPGHGNTKEDSHYGNAYVYETKDDLENNEFQPFRAGIDAGARQWLRKVFLLLLRWSGLPVTA